MYSEVYGWNLLFTGLWRLCKLLKNNPQQQTSWLYSVLFQVLSVQQNWPAFKKGHMNRQKKPCVWRGTFTASAVQNIRTSCCAARQPAAESLFGLSSIWFCRSPPATEERHGYSPPEMEKIYRTILFHCRNHEPNTEETNNPLVKLFLKQQIKIMFSPYCWYRPSSGLDCPGECLARWFLPRRYLCSCSHPHNPETPETQQLQVRINKFFNVRVNKSMYEVITVMSFI